MRTFTRKTNRVNGVGGDKVRAADVNELQVAIEDLQDGTLPINAALPAGGAIAQVLAKASAVDYDFGWASIDGSGVLPPGTDGQELRYRDGAPAFVKSREAFLNDRADIDATGATDMATTIQTYLDEYAAAGVSRVYGDAGSIYLVGSTIDIPAGMFFEGAPYSAQFGASAASTTEFKCNADSVTMLRLVGRGSSVTGLRINLNSKASAVGIRPNSHFQLIDRVRFSNGAATATGVKGGGILYFEMRDCMYTDGFSGRGADFLDSYADVPGDVYYGVNVGRFERNAFGCGAGGLRVEGTFTARDNDFEAAYTNPAFEHSAASATGYCGFYDNYFEITGGVNQAIKIGAGNGCAISGNYIDGHDSATAGGYGVSVATYGSRVVITGNNFNQFETGIALPAVIDTAFARGSALIAGNSFSPYVTTQISGVMGGVQRVGLGTDGPYYTQSSPQGHIFGGGRVVTEMAQLEGSATEVDLSYANAFTMNQSSAATLTYTNAIAGHTFTMRFQTANCTLNHATWNLRSGVNETPAAGTTKQFSTDHAGAVYELGPPAMTALTAEDSGTVNSGDSGTDDVIENLRTRLGELESRLQDRGMLA